MKKFYFIKFRRIKHEGVRRLFVFFAYSYIIGILIFFSNVILKNYNSSAYYAAKAGLISPNLFSSWKYFFAYIAVIVLYSFAVPLVYGLVLIFQWIHDGFKK